MASALALLFTAMLLIASDATGRIDFVDIIPSKKILTNTSNNPIAVYSQDLVSKKVLTFLQPGLSLPHVSSVNSNEWNYVNLNGQIASVRSENVTVTYIVLEKYYLTPEFVNGFYLTGLLGSVISISALLGLAVIGKSGIRNSAADSASEGFELDFDYKNTDTQYGELENKKLDNRISENKKQDSTPLVKTADKTQKLNLFSEDEARQEQAELNKKEELKKKEESEKKAEEARLVKLQEEQRLEQKRKELELIAKKTKEEARKIEAIKVEAKKAEALKIDNRQSDKHKKETARLRHELIVTANQESQARYRGEATIVEMRSSYDRLFARYKSVKAEAEAMRLKFDDQKYKNLLSVRGFQIYLVNSLISENKFTILEWIPDKGYGSDTSIESNVSPNLIVQDNRGNVLGLVCKYRSSYYLENKKKEVCWASELQSEQYSKFSRSRNMPLYFVIGLRGKYNAPKYNFLVSLDEISKYSKRVNDSEKGFQLAVNCKDIADKLVEKGNYSDCLDRIASEL